MCFSFKAQKLMKQGVFKEYFNQILNDTESVSSKVYDYPTLISPETRWEIGLSSLYILKRDLETD